MSEYMKKNTIQADSDIKKAVLERVKAEREVMEQAKADREASENKPSQEDAEPSPYFMRDGYLCRSKTTKDGGEISIRLANFSAQISGETIVDDGQEIQHQFKIIGKLRGSIPLPEIEIPASNFTGMNWLTRWGARPVLSPGQTVKDCVRHSIQVASGDVQVETFYGHTGWREINGKQCFLHAGGAIGGPDGVAVRLPKELEQRYKLPPLPPNNPEAEKAARKGLQASLDFLDIGRRSITIPLWAGVFLSPLVSILSPSPNFVLFLQGISGTFKSTLAVLASAHFGAFVGVEGLSNFSDTAGVIEKRAFILKDVLTVIDDWHPAGNRHSAEAMEQTAQRMIRSYSNRTGRARLNSDMTERQRYHPRGLALLTAEELPTLESTLARLCVIAIEDGDIDREKLSALQAEAEFLPYAMGLYILFLKRNYYAIIETFPARFRELRQAAAEAGFHRKLPEQVAYLAYAVEMVSAFFLDQGMIDEDASQRLNDEAWETFRLLSQRQQQRIQDDNPIDRFFDVIQTLLIQHAARLEPLPTCEGAPLGAGDRIGYYDQEAVYLLPVAAWHAVQAFSQKEGSHFPLGKHSFFAMLRSKGIITASPRGDHHVFLKIGGKSIRVLKIIEGGIYRKTVETVTE
jgi:hypothetical protein